jgi:hypothetical protein
VSGPSFPCAATVAVRQTVIALVIVLGSRSSHTSVAARDVVAYLTGDQANRLTANGSRTDAVPDLSQASSPGAYYSDAAERAGRWRGIETSQLGEFVEPTMLQRVLLGQDPVTGTQLVKAQGSSGRTTQRRAELPAGGPDDLIPIGQATAAIGVDRRYLLRLATNTATYRSSHDPPTTDVSSTVALTGAYLDAVKVDGKWRITRAEVQRFMATRHEPPVVIGYDLTFSASKSLSIVWATGGPETRALCEEAFEAGVAKGVEYLESHAIWVRRGRGYESAGGMLAASYRHDTNRELEPQLHEHVVTVGVRGEDAAEHLREVMNAQ